ncbi:MAG TPA: tRNA uracil 4-sulfurtransferase ThiI [Virgibacillus sp.]|nr:tRNA uracil 4-sulfurtransferase ThiI [Virgibacillus sp.]
MQYDHILIRYGEIGLKGNNTRFFLKRLQKNIEHKLQGFPHIHVQQTQGRLFILLNGHDPEPIVAKCKNIFGIYSLSTAIKVENDMEAIKEAALYALKSNEDAETFKVNVRRVNKSFPGRSQEMNQLLGGHLLRNTTGITVNVHHPDVEVQVEVRNKATYVTSQQTKGLGGLPVGTGGKSLLLLSGGIDSPVAGYLAMKRGVQVDAIHFHSPPFTSERAKQKVIDLAEKLTVYGNQVKIHMVPFTKLQQAIFKDIPDRYTMTIMRRIMMRISERVCEQEAILSMTTGENLGQVASQTMGSMNAINEVTNYPILRPLITMDKEEIIKISEQIDTYDISIRPFEDCCTVFMPKAPKTNPTREKVNYFESQVDFSDLITEALQGIEVVLVTDADVDSSFSDLL